MPHLARLAAFALLFAPALHAQTQPCEAALKSRYDAAQTLQASGDRHQAAQQFSLFLAQALRCIAVDRAHLGEYPAAAPLFRQAVQLAPNDAGLRLDFASAALSANDIPEAKSLLAIPEQQPCTGPLCARQSFLRGRLLFATGDIRAARTQFESAVQGEPTFEHGYALAKADLALADKPATAALFREMLASFGDTPTIHLDFGRAYAEADFPEDAIAEFNKTLARDSTFPEAHYCLGAAYLLRSGDTSLPAAEAEFHKELALHPNDAFSLSQLGYIAMTQHDLTTAEANLRRAAQLDPTNPDNFLLLGPIYADLHRPAEAEAALRSAIAATSDPSRNHFQIRGAHYQLGRLLLQQGKTAEAKQEMAATQSLLLQNRILDQVNISGKPVSGYQFPQLDQSNAANSQARTSARAFEHQLAPAIADAYNNLGAAAASDKLYSQALPYFQQAYTWNPAMEGLDANWGRAAFAAGNYAEAATALNRVLLAHPAAPAIREPLGMSYFLLADYPATVRVLAPIRTQLPTSPLLDYAYAESLLRTGSREEGIVRLQAIRGSNPDMGLAALGLGRALAESKDFNAAEPHLRAAFRLRSHDPQAAFQLASALFALGHDDEAQKLLATLVPPEATTDPQLLLSISSLQSDHAMPDAAAANLQAAATLSRTSQADIQSRSGSATNGITAPIY